VVSEYVLFSPLFPTVLGGSVLFFSGFVGSVELPAPRFKKFECALFFSFFLMLSLVIRSLDTVFPSYCATPLSGDYFFTLSFSPCGLPLQHFFYLLEVGFSWMLSAFYVNLSGLKVTLPPRPNVPLPPPPPSSLWGFFPPTKPSCDS